MAQAHRELSTTSVEARGTDDELVVVTQSWEEQENYQASRVELFSLLIQQKRAAKFHLKEYDHFKKLLKEEVNAEANTGPAHPDMNREVLKWSDSPNGHSENYWNMKVARDSLIADLTAMEELLEEMGKELKEQVYWKKLLASLSLGLFFPTLNATHIIGGTLAGLTSSVAIPFSLFLAYGSIRCLTNATVVDRNKSQTKSIMEAVKMEDPEDPKNSKSKYQLPKLKAMKWIYR